MCIRSVFIYAPFAVWLLAVLLFVTRCGFRVRGQARWTMWLLLCAAKFLCFSVLGGDAFVPEFPDFAIWAWDWAYSGFLILVPLACVTFFWRGRAKPWVLAALAWGLSAWGVYNGVRAPATHEVEMAFADLPAELDGYRIAHVSDLHVSSAARRPRTEAIVAAVNAAKPDLVCLTGDFVDGVPERRYGDLEPIRDLKAKDGVYAVTGNHEFYFPWHAWRPIFVRWNIRMLEETCVSPRPGLALGGVDDIAQDRLREGAAKWDYPCAKTAFAQAPKGAFRVFLEHRPRNAPANFAEGGVRLQLSGHTHGGIMPGMAEIVRRHNRGFVRGVYEMPGGGKLYVSPGAGQWAGFPIRFFNPSEVTVIVLRRAEGRG